MTDWMEAAGATHAGRVRRANEDSWAYSAGAGVFVVCDGMGGAAGGAVASRLAAEAFVERLEAVAPEARDEALLHAAVEGANRRVWARAQAEPALRGMGTTLVGLAARDPRAVLVAHVGDSRAYRFRGVELRRLTEDHSFVHEQVRMGLMRPEEAERSPMRNMITRAVGTREMVEAAVRMIAVQPGDLLLLCSDGVSKELGDAGIADALGLRGTVRERVDRLIERVLAAGGRDNATAVLVEVR